VADVVILGAGLTGLSAAYHLEQAGIEYEIFEKSDRPGGLLKSVQESGYTFDHTGHFLHISDEYFKSFLDETVSIASFDVVQRRSAIFSQGILTEYPFQMNLYGLPTSIMAECIEGFVKRSKRSTNDADNFHEWVLQHFGKGFGKYFFFPYNKKILAYDLKKVHPSWTGRFVPSTSLENIIEGCCSPTQKTDVGYNSSFYYPKMGGIESIIMAIRNKLFQSIQSGHEAAAIDPITHTIHFTNGSKKKYKHLISTLPLNRLLKILHEPSSSTMATAEQKLLHNSVVNINIGFNTSLPFDKHWIYFPEEMYPFYRLGFWHNVSASLVPKGHSAVYGEFSYLPNNTSAGELQKMITKTRNKIIDFIGLNPHHKTIEKTLHIEHAYVIYDTWRQQNLPLLLNQLQEAEIYSIGRYGAWKYSSMQEAYQDGKAVAAAIQQLVNDNPQFAKKGTHGISATAFLS
jgi:protoporphyrinogen oxidase